ncbi:MULTISPECIES: S8 family serine peptidase [unclassified Caballeronia]|uniref:S8 family peptidase n=1 Tax=unclassified Caballeronia TaxID=2646786 RepID=UPI002861F33E|nr:MULTISPECIES: S8 family serine peptidase [unclassified Caballeronia]MDR5753005.1 S8 family serine peptidase [Caballeronia sp. LZ024]MDR5845097.1 S8 family serine peptidase [Caballeronia sp. LZ031]
MKEAHIILRAKAPAALAYGLEVAAAGGASPAVKLSIEELDRSDVAKVAKEADVRAVAPFVPMKLIEPKTGLDDGVYTPKGPDDIAWGIQAVGADNSPFTGEGVVVAVLDTGIDVDQAAGKRHAAFVGVHIEQKNFTTESDIDTHGHGTHCAGTIFGQDVGGMRIGVARGVKSALIAKVLGAGGGSSETIVSAVQWAIERGAHIISMSLGIDFPGYQAQLVAQGLPAPAATSRALEGYRQNVLLFARLAALYSTKPQAALFIAAAGNESDRDHVPPYEIAASPPAVSDGFLPVGALGQDGGKLKIASFSNSEPVLCGPGVNIVSAARGDGLVTMSGTSMATPHVAGVAALWAQKLMSQNMFSPATVRASLTALASMKQLAPGFDTLDVGSGLVVAPV